MAAEQPPMLMVAENTTVNEINGAMGSLSVNGEVVSPTTTPASAPASCEPAEPEPVSKRSRMGAFL